ncbi:MAG: histidine kinase dimerization/phosphoacceptor domain -containing protein [Terricaulis sp.]
MSALRRKPLAAFGLGVVLFLLTLLIRYLAGDTLLNFPTLLFTIATVITALFCGGLTALVFAIASFATVWVFFLPPPGPDVVGPTRSTARVVAFAISTGIYIGVIQLMHLAIDRMRAQRERVGALLLSREAMFKEMQHRIANNMQFISALLSMQQKRFVGTPAGDALEEASSRLRAMSRIHRQLYDPANADRAFGPLIEDLCHELLEATGAKNIVCRVDVPPIALSMDRVVALTLIVNEALTNTIKHAFPDGRAGTIRIGLERLSGNELSLVISDNGKGLPDGFDLAAAQSLGMRIFHALANQLGGVLSFVDTRPGAELRVRFAAS